MAFDFKKEYKEFYLPPANYIAVRGVGNPNDDATCKKKTDFSRVEYFHYEEGRCVQCMHVGSYDLEPITIGKMKVYDVQQGLSIIQ